MAEDIKESEKKKEEDNRPMFYGSATVGSRGQIVIPSELREELNIEPSDKLIFVDFPARKNEFSVMKTEAIFDIEEMAKRLRKEADMNSE